MRNRLIRGRGVLIWRLCLGFLCSSWSLISDDPGRYIEAGTGKMKTLMTFISTSFVEYLLAVAEFDQAIWMINP